MSRKGGTAISFGGGGKQDRGGPVSATSSWVEGTQGVMKKELVDQIVADQLERLGSERLPIPFPVADGGDLAL